MTNNEICFKDHLLIAMPGMDDPNFHQAVVYIYDHNKSGATGLVINKPLRLTLGDVLKHIKISTENKNVENLPVMLGGPVANDQGFIIHRGHAFPEIPESLSEDEVSVSASKAMLRIIANGDTTSELIITLGYSAWAAGQLEMEITQNAWLVAPLDPRILFHTPCEHRWRAAAALIGVDIRRLSPDTGHA